MDSLSQQLIAALLQLPCYVHWENKQGEVLGCNQQFASFFGVDDCEEIIGRLRKDLYQIEDPVSFEKAFQEVLETQASISTIQTLPSVKGKPITLRCLLSPIMNQDKVEGVLSIALELSHSEDEFNFLRQVVERMPGHVWWTDDKGTLLGSNDKMAVQMGFKDADAIIGRGLRDIMSADLSDEDREAIYENVMGITRKVIETGESFIGEEIGEMGGVKATFYSQKAPLRDINGNIIGLVGVAQDITELKQTQAKLEHANQVKAEFIANMSHDLRTPITGMLGETNYIAKNAENAEVKESAHYLKEATEQLLRLSDDIVEYMSLESGRSSGVISIFNPREVIHNVATLMRASLRHKSLDLNVEVDDKVPEAVKGFGQYFERILSNLVANAIKFTDEGSISIVLTSEKEQDEQILLTLKVKDTGVGIPKDKYEDVFEQFYKLSSSYKGIYKGSGLGLYAVKQYVGQMQGRIHLESELGKGTVFIVTAPFEKADAEDAVVVDLSQATLLDANEKLEKISMPNENIKQNQTKKVLVVEDSPLPARAVVRLLKDHQCEAEVAESGEAAVEAVTNNAYDLILMDLGLPGIDGIEATQLIRGLPEHNTAPIVALTGHGRAEKSAECVEAGMQAVYTKPLNASQLKTILKTYVEAPKDSATSKVQAVVDKLVLDVQRTMEQFEMKQPKQMLDMLEVTEEFIPSQLEELRQAVKDEDLTALQKAMHNLKGGLSYLVAPECNDLTITWDNVINQDPITPQIMGVMLKQIEHALQVLHKAIKALITELEKH